MTEYEQCEYTHRPLRFVYAMCTDDVNHFPETDCLRGVLDTEYNDSESCTAVWRLVVVVAVATAAAAG